MSEIKYMTIDPGWSGAIAMLDTQNNLRVDYMPETMYDILDYFKGIEIAADAVCLLEKVGSMPGNGVKSVWRFSENATSLKCGLYINNIPFKEVTPQSWMKKLGTAIPKDKKTRKNKLKMLAQQAFPQVKVTLNNSDALCMLITERK